MKAMRDKSSQNVATLYNICKSYCEDPDYEISRLAGLGYTEGILDRPRYEVLRSRVPFPGFKQKTLKELGNQLNLTGTRVRQLEKSAVFHIMAKYLNDRWTFDRDHKVVVIESR